MQPLPKQPGMTIAKLAAGVALLMALAMAGLIGIGMTLFADVWTVSDRWQAYEVEAGTKTDALSELRALFGLGGLVDHYHEFQMSGTPDDLTAVKESLRLVRANLDAYRSVGASSTQEEAAIAELFQTLDRMEAKLQMIGDGFAHGQSQAEIISATRIDLEPAAQALKSLDGELSRLSSQLTQSNIEGLEHLRGVMIYGGGISACVMLLVSGLIVWTAKRRVIAPLSRLVEDSRRLALLELDHPYHWPRSDELGELGRTLDNTRQTLRLLFAENEEKTKRLSFQATHDHLTGLPNRALLIEWLGVRLGHPRNAPLALLFLDLDGFKMVNDSLGHSIGDQLLKAVGQRLCQCQSDSDLVVRLGGDEFVVVVSAGGHEAALDRAHQIEQCFAHPFAIQGMDLCIATSIGIAMDDGHASEPEDLLRDADIALYRAKESGRGRTEIFDVALREAVQIRHRLQRDLDHAIQSQEIFVVYQPIMRLDTSVITGFEALIRWNHPDLGLISPVQFIPVAEETGAILALGSHVLEKAAQDLTRFRQRGDWAAELTVNVNFSPRQMWDDTHVLHVMEQLALSTFSGIKIEVTESLAMTNPDAAREILMRFHNLGVKLCMDDFGTGYSSLSYLGRFPFDVLKMDKSFISELTHGRPEQRRLVQGVVNLAHDLGLEVVAEGIETQVEMDQLRRFGCDLGQGFLIAKPMAAQAACDFLDQRAAKSCSL